MITGLLASAGIGIFNSLVSKHGEDLVTKGIEKVTGIDLKDRTEPLTAKEKQLIVDNQYKIENLNFEKMKEENRSLDNHTGNVKEQWVSDNNSDSWLAKNIRPLGFLYMLLVFTFMIFFDGNVGEFKINEGYFPIIQALLITMAIAYYGSRGVEKTMKHIKGK